jgi:isopenicillin N synthase-like dioxygenase
MITSQRLQTVDFSSPTASQDFTQSIRDTGFAVISNHPISQKLIQDAFSEWDQFFQTESKTLYTFEPATQSGYFPFRSENAKNYSIKDLKEFFHYYPWTKLPPQAANHTPLLYKEMEALGLTLLDWIEVNTPIEIRKHYSMSLRKMAEASPETLLRPIHYPPIQGQVEPGAVRAAAHEDINLITLLPAATEPGLQVLDLNGLWHDVPCDRGTIVINSGDMLKMASDNYFPSTTHRVVNPQGADLHKARYSMPLFLHPKNEVRLSPQHTAQSYLDERLRQIGLKS